MAKKPITLSIEKSLIEEIDDFVNSQVGFENRSHFFTVVASEVLRKKKQKDAKAKGI